MPNETLSDVVRSLLLGEAGEELELAKQPGGGP